MANETEQLVAQFFHGMRAERKRAKANSDTQRLAEYLAQPQPTESRYELTLRRCKEANERNNAWWEKHVGPVD